MNITTPGKGHNRPAETPFDSVSNQIDLLLMEAQNWLDGTGVESQAQADMVAKLLDDARKAKTAADNARKAEAKPFDDGKADVQARYKPLLGKADMVADLCKKVLAPFLDAQDRAKREAEAKAREEADRLAAEARAAFKAANTTDIVARERAEQAALEAKEAEKAAAAMARDKGQAKGGARAVGLRTYYDATVHDEQEFGRYVWLHHRTELRVFLDDLARRLVHGQPTRPLPGVTITERRVAV